MKVFNVPVAVAAKLMNKNVEFLYSCALWEQSKKGSHSLW